MQIAVKQGQIQNEDTQLIVVNLFQGVTEPGGALKAVDQAMDGLIGRLLADGDFKGELGETHLLYTGGAVPAPRVLIAGLGKQEDFTLERVRQAAAAAARRVSKLGLTRYSTVVHGAGAGGLDPSQAAQVVVEGSLLGLYRFAAHTASPDDKAVAVEAITLVEFDEQKVDAARAGAAVGQVAAELTNFARDLANEPSNLMTPTILAGRIREQAEAVGLGCQVFGEEEMAALGAGSFLGIAQGSDEEAQFIVLEHWPTGIPRDGLTTVAIVGKAITFDTGGISLKSHENLWKMKNDMGGGAATAAALLAAARLNLPVHAVGIIPATENMPSGRAIKPGDVLTAMNGKTVEIISTDAEGRQVLADGLVYAARFQPAALVDVATLTGSIGIALGREVAGLFANDDELAQRLLAAGDLAGEPLWRMPLYKPYRRLLESDVADLKHTGGRWGGSINAALFLQEFAGDFPWAHLDIAGTTWQDEAGPYSRSGGTGFSTRLLIELLRSYAS